MKDPKISLKEIAKKAIITLLLIVIALTSIFVISKPATSPESYKSTIESIEAKQAAVTGITAAAAATSTALAAIPGDVTTPIADHILEISSYLLLVVCVLVLEKSMLTIMGYLAFNILIPISCGLFGIYTFIRKTVFKELAWKFIILALVFATIIPISLKFSDMIYEVNKVTIEQVTTDINNSLEKTPEEKSWLDNLIDKIETGVAQAGEKAKQILNKFIDVIAIFIIAYCAIPLIIILVVLWFIKFLFGIKISIPEKEKLLFLKKLKKKDDVFELTEV